MIFQLKKLVTKTGAGKEAYYTKTGAGKEACCTKTGAGKKPIASKQVREKDIYGYWSKQRSVASLPRRPVRAGLVVRTVRVL